MRNLLFVVLRNGQLLLLVVAVFLQEVVCCLKLVTVTLIDITLVLGILLFQLRIDDGLLILVEAHGLPSCLTDFRIGEDLLLILILYIKFFFRTLVSLLLELVGLLLNLAEVTLMLYAAFLTLTLCVVAYLGDARILDGILHLLPFLGDALLISPLLLEELLTLLGIILIRVVVLAGFLGWCCDYRGGLAFGVLTEKYLIPLLFGDFPHVFVFVQRIVRRFLRVYDVIDKTADAASEINQPVTCILAPPYIPERGIAKLFPVLGRYFVAVVVDLLE